MCWLVSLPVMEVRGVYSFTWKWKWSRSVMSDSLQPTGYRLLWPWDFPGKNTGVGCHFLLQEIFPTQELNLGLLHCRQTLYHLSHQGSASLDFEVKRQISKHLYQFLESSPENLHSTNCSIVIHLFHLLSMEMLWYCFVIEGSYIFVFGQPNIWTNFCHPINDIYMYIHYIHAN